ncbi:archaetidylserine decarboxylase [Phaeobacter gallaeciensis]|uniref:phosphatidylserine decarboxylase n=1 Tax=Phaeobacter gallaeciensis TaxID=60890 RepID=A0AAC9Z8L3_9RHOB|nr:archaetidylserine decarboxylase [Phaeobacter gallaeciensis]AHD09707.1 phosphatidylserine decarboxylase precursor [Phaeobacter gallaeciensis DSM 26640]ATE92971.1 phosphatidylserine decarboxylase precursor [Phaeobacter gallaeciensis]ATE97207.1 phosphatidylserine decarboxylase precursor [Phaeobacter gallaeciensis]ATF01636.1 phosphatidylserine decarboxylase precursor [Phaeobacter gallaeciensis]ATF06016.1 phosphatidylserine decarboxylase precursor [Phaeobacter gallaeciensis]
MQRDPILVVDRDTGETFEEVVLGEKWIRWAYQNASAKPVEKLLFRSALISRLMGAWFDSRFSRGKISAVIEDLSIDMSEATRQADKYNTFNDFFARNLRPEARPFDPSPSVIASPADGRVLVFPELTEDVFVPIKGHPMSIRTMLPGIADRFIGGALAIVRLCPADYHRYHFPASGRISAAKDLPGALHSVNPIALGAGPDVFGENKRSWTLIDTDTIGSYAFVEVGAFGVGSIINTRTSGAVEKMDEKGYFKFGGSTVVVVFEPGRVQFSDDLVANSAKGRETLVKVGQPLATAI